MTTFVIRLDTDSTNYGMNFMIFEALIEHLPKTINFIPFFSNSDLVFICCFNEPEGESEQKLFSCCENLGDFIDTEFNVNYNIGIGIFTSKYPNLRQAIPLHCKHSITVTDLDKETLFILMILNQNHSFRHISQN